jgi:hypothetical protein
MSPPKKPLFEPDEVTAPVAEATPAAGVDDAEALDEVGTPPEPDVVASRALMVGVMLERARLEATGDVAPLARLRHLVERHGLLSNLGAEGLALFEAEAGAWSADDTEAVRWTAEELHLLLWALGLVVTPTLDARADADALLLKLPLAGDVDAFLDGATLRPLEQLEIQRELWEVLLQAVETEIYARSVLADPTQLDDDAELEEFLRAMEAEGFDRRAAAALGRPKEAALGLRHEVRLLLGALFGEGSPHRAQQLDADRLVAMEEEELATFYGLAHTRAGACAWLVEGDADEDEAAAE